MSRPSPTPPAAAFLWHRQAVVDGPGSTGTGPEPDLRYTAHALHRMASLGFTRDEVRDTISNPLWTRPNGRAHPQDRRVVVGPSLLVVWHPITNVVVTVILRTAEPYHHGQHDRQNLPAAA